MKKVVFLFALLCIVSQTFAQKKGKVDPKDLQIDSLRTVNVFLSAQLDSISKEKDVYFGLYKVLKDEVIHYDFDPAKSSFLIDSLKSSRDSASFWISSGIDSLRDSIHDLKAECELLQMQLNEVNLTQSDKALLVTELKQLKELLDLTIITQADFDAKKTLVMDKWK